MDLCEKFMLFVLLGLSWPFQALSFFMLSLMPFLTSQPSRANFEYDQKSLFRQIFKLFLILFLSLTVCNKTMWMSLWNAILFILGIFLYWTNDFFFQFLTQNLKNILYLCICYICVLGHGFLTFLFNPNDIFLTFFIPLVVGADCKLRKVLWGFPKRVRNFLSFNIFEFSFKIG